MSYNLWVEFNGVERDGTTATLAAFAEPGFAMAVGDHLIVGDEEGNRCWAEILSNDGVVIGLRLAMETFKAFEVAS